jgi:hypothetical protein
MPFAIWTIDAGTPLMVSAAWITPRSVPRHNGERTYDWDYTACPNDEKRITSAAIVKTANRMPIVGRVLSQSLRISAYGRTD